VAQVWWHNEEILGLLFLPLVAAKKEACAGEGTLKTSEETAGVKSLAGRVH
jgi:hypothetical protein